MKIVEGWWVMMVRGAQLSGSASHLGLPPMEAQEATLRLVVLLLGFVLVQFLAVTPRRVEAAVRLAQMRPAVAFPARLPAARPADDLTAASQ
jgi:hypothetical protein